MGNDLSIVRVDRWSVTGVSIHCLPGFDPTRGTYF